MNAHELVRDPAVERLVASAKRGRLSRRAAIGRLALLGLSVPAASAAVRALSPTPAAAAAQSFKGQTLVVTSYGGTWQDFMLNEHIPQFEAETGAKVELAIGLAKDWFAKMQAAGKDRPPYDVFVTNETYLAQLRAEGYFAPLPPDQVPNLKFVPKALRQPNDVGVLGLVGALGITYRTDMVQDAPTSWFDLGKYGTKTTIFNIGNSGEPQHVMKMAQVLTGSYKNWKPAIDWIAKHLCAARQVDFSGTEQTMLTQGETSVGLIDAPDWSFLKAKGLPVAWVLPKEGYCGMFEQDMNVCAGSKVKELGYAFINYWLSAPVQKKWAEKFYWTPANTQVNISPDAAKLIPVTPAQLGKIPRWDYVWLNSSGAREGMADAWNHQVGGHC
ncbi:MAG TPA: extracellular solute-binding protein [bacterium]|nr:extracellular solute-binding protein [bacterium]